MKKILSVFLIVFFFSSFIVNAQSSDRVTVLKMVIELLEQQIILLQKQLQDLIIQQNNSAQVNLNQVNLNKNPIVSPIIAPEVISLPVQIPIIFTVSFTTSTWNPDGEIRYLYTVNANKPFSIIEMYTNSCGNDGWVDVKGFPNLKMKRYWNYRNDCTFAKDYNDRYVGNKFLENNSYSIVGDSQFSLNYLKLQSVDGDIWEYNKN